MKPTDDTLAPVLVVNDLDDLPDDLALRAVVGFTMRGAFVAMNSRCPLKRWASLGGDR